MIEDLPEGTITLLFTDSVGSTALATDLGDEAARELFEIQARVVRDAVEEHGGREIDAVGDSFLIGFTSTLQAAACGIDIQRNLRRYNLVHPERPIRVRMGLNCGELAKKLGGMYGGAINAAARICAKADGGQIFASSIVKELIGSAGDMRFEDRGRHELKGFPQSWNLHEIRWQDAVSTAETLALALKRPTPFVGREDELAALEELVDAATGGQGGTAMLTGEPGLGKSRLAAEAGAYARSAGCSVLVGHSYEASGAPAYAPLVEALRPLVSRSTTPALRGLLGDAAPWVAKLLPELRRRFRSLPDPPSLPPEQERHLLIAGVVDFIVTAARRTPILLVLEDVHWTDAPTLRLLQHLAQRAQDEPIAIIGTYRDTEIGPKHALTETLVELHRQRISRSLDLPLFDREGVRAMLLALAEDEPPKALVDAIYAESEGNPFFVEEVVKFFIDERRLFGEGGSWKLDLTLDIADVPPGVILVVGRRLSRLSERCRRALSIAAIIGKNFSFEVLQAVVDLDGDEVLAGIEEAERAQIVQERRGSGSSEFTFAHELFRQTLNAELSAVRRERAHLRVAEAIERIAAHRAGDHAAALVYHFARGGSAVDSKKLLLFRVLAGDQALAASGFEEAVRHFEDALPLARADGERANLLFKLGRARHSAGRWDAAAEAWRAAAVAFEGCGAAQGAERACYELASLHGWRGQGAEALEAMQRGLSIAPDSSSEPRCRLLALQGMVLTLGRQPLLGAQYLAQARAIAEKREDPALTANVLSMTGIHQWVRTQFHESIESLENAADLLRSVGDVWGLSQCYAYQLPQRGYLGDYPVLDRRLAQLRELAERLGDRSAMAMHDLFRGILVMVRGRLAEAEPFLRKAEEAARTSAGRILPAVIHNRALLHFFAGDLEQSEALFTEAAQVYDSSGKTADMYEGPLCLLYLRAFRGDREGARDLLSEVPEPDGDTESLTCSSCDAMVIAAEALVMLGLNERAASFHTPIAAMVERGVWTTSGVFPLLQRVLGMLAAACQRWDEAEERYRAALTQARESGLRKELAETTYWCARLALERSDGRNPARAAALLGGAIEEYRQIGMPRHLERAEALLSKARSVEPRMNGSRN